MQGVKVPFPNHDDYKPIMEQRGNLTPAEFNAAVAVVALKLIGRADLVQKMTRTRNRVLLNLLEVEAERALRKWWAEQDAAPAAGR